MSSSPARTAVVSTDDAGSPYAPSPYVVRSRKEETGDIATLVLAPADGAVLRPFVPGQFNMVYAFGVGEAAISISGPLGPEGELVHTVQALGPTSRALFGARPGTVVGVRGPYGTGWPLERAVGKDVVIAAGGLGLPPLRPLLYRLLAERERYGRIEVVYGARTPKHLVFYDELQTWRARPDLRFQVTVDVAGREWYGDVGVVTTRLPDARFEPADTVAFVCGPEVMMRFTVQALLQRGVPAEAIFLSMERNMKCAIGLCGHCQFGPDFVCRDGPVFSYRRIGPYFSIREV
jgi:NAD(P)H-flavin reductase